MGPEFESQPAVPPLNNQNFANLNVAEFNHETSLVSTLVNARNSKILPRHGVRSPVYFFSFLDLIESSHGIFSSDILFNLHWIK